MRLADALTTISEFGGYPEELTPSERSMLDMVVKECIRASMIGNDCVEIHSQRYSGLEWTGNVIHILELHGLNLETHDLFGHLVHKISWPVLRSRRAFTMRDIVFNDVMSCNFMRQLND